MNPTAVNSTLKQPYPGLRPFQQDEARIFFGRADEINRMLARLEEHRFLAVVGGSGSGKSSLVRAGLLPVLGQGYLLGAGTDWKYVVMKPGDDPFRNLAAEFHRAMSGGAAPAAGDIAFTQAELRTSPRGFLEVVEEAGLNRETPLLLLVDQFEEIFRFRRRSSAANAAGAAGGAPGFGGRAIHEERNDATAFVNLLLTTAEGAGKAERPIYVMITMRSDFIGDCEVFPGLPQAVSDSQFLVPRMTRRQMQEVIEKPLLLFHGKAAPELVNRMLNDAGTDPDQLPLMQHALMRTWQAALGRAGREAEEIVMTLADYESVGRFSEALCRHLEEAWALLKGVQERRIAQQLFLCLSERAGGEALVRRMARLGEVAAVANAEPGEVTKVVRIFQEEGRNFIMASPWGELNAETVLDISHEALLRQWARLREWLEEEAKSADRYVRLADTAARWKAGDAELLQGRELDRALEWRQKGNPTAAWAERYHAGFADAISFLERSQAEAVRRAKEKQDEADRRAQEEKARQERELEDAKRLAEERKLAADRQRKWLVLAVFLLVLSLAGLIWGMAEKYDAQVKAKEAGDEKKAAGQLIDYMQEDLTDSLKSLGVLKIMYELNERIQKYYQEHPPEAGDTFALHGQGVSLAQLGDVFQGEGQVADALTSYLKSREIAESLVRKDPNNTDWQAELGEREDNVGDVLLEQGHPAEALEAYRKSLAIDETLAKRDPKNADWQRNVSADYSHVGDVLESQNQYPEALDAYQGALTIDQGLARMDPNNAKQQRFLSVDYTDVGDVLEDQKKEEGALASYRMGLGIDQSLAERNPGDSEVQYNLSVDYASVGGVLKDQGKFEEALASFWSGLAIDEKLIDKDADNADWQNEVSEIYDDIGDTLSAQGHLEEAIEAYSNGLFFAERQAKKDSTDTDAQNQVAWARYGVANSLFNTPGSDLKEAKRLVDAGIETLTQLKKKATLDKAAQDTWDKLTALRKALDGAKNR
jgi:tetratricopeptide (TPR) repeat protein